MSSEVFECPICGEEIEVEIWHDGECPECGNDYWWTEERVYDDDGYEEECWETLEWGAYEPSEDSEDDYDGDDEDM